jgi:hypothetical protein
MMLIFKGMIYFFGSQLSISVKIFLISKSSLPLYLRYSALGFQNFSIKIDEQLNYIDQGLNKALSSSGLF